MVKSASVTVNVIPVGAIVVAGTPTYFPSPGGGAESILVPVRNTDPTRPQTTQVRCSLVLDLRPGTFLNFTSPVFSVQPNASMTLDDVLPSSWRGMGVFHGTVWLVDSSGNATSGMYTVGGLL